MYQTKDNSSHLCARAQKKPVCLSIPFKPKDPKDTARGQFMHFKIVNDASDKILNTILQYFVGDRMLLMKVLTATSCVG